MSLERKGASKVDNSGVKVVERRKEGKGTSKDQQGKRKNHVWFADNSRRGGSCERKFQEDILEDDIEKIAEQGNNEKRFTFGVNSRKRANSPKATRQPKHKQKNENKQPIDEKPKSTPHISERPNTHLQTLVQSVYYADDQSQKDRNTIQASSKPNIPYQKAGQPKRNQIPLKEAINVQDYQKIYRTQQKVPKKARFEDTFFQQRKPLYNPQTINKKSQPCEDQIYRLLAQKHRSSTLPNLKQYDRDVIHPPISKAPERVIFNKIRKQPPRQNIKFNHSHYPSKFGYDNIKSSLARSFAGFDPYYGKSLKTLYPVNPMFSVGGYLEPRTSREYGRSRDIYAYLFGGMRNSYGHTRRLY